MGYSFLGLITLLLVYQLIGELIVLLLHWPIPGPVIGMFLLFLTLLLRDQWAQPWIAPSQQFLNHLSLFFVPAGVGVMLHLGRIGDEWLAIVVALVLSTLVSLVVTAWLMQIFSRLISRPGRDQPHG